MFFVKISLLEMHIDFAILSLLDTLIAIFPLRFLPQNFTPRDAHCFDNEHLKMLESRPEDELVKLVKTVETVESVETEDTV